MFNQRPSEGFGLRIETKSAHQQLDAALKDYKKEHTTENTERFLKLYREFAAMDLNVGAEYLLKTKEKSYGYRYFDYVEQEMMKVLATYDPDRAMKMYHAEFVSKSYKEDLAHNLARWSCVITPENAEAILTNIASHTPNADLVAGYEAKSEFWRRLMEAALVHATENNDARRILELVSVNGHETIQSKPADVLSKAMIEQMKVAENETDLKKIQQFVLDGLKSRLTYRHDFGNDKSLELDAYLERFLAKLPEETLWKMAEDTDGTLKQTLEEECVLRIAQKNPEDILQDKYAEVVQRNGMKTMLFAVIEDEGIRSQIGPAPKSERYGDNGTVFFGPLASRHLEVAVRAMEIFQRGASTYINERQEDGTFKSVTYDRALYYAFQNLKNHSETGMAVMEDILSQRGQGTSSNDGDKTIWQEYPKLKPESAIRLLSKVQYEYGRGVLLSVLPENHFVQAVTETFSANPEIAIKTFRSVFSNKEQLGAFVRHIHEYPPEFVDKFFEAEWADFDASLERYHYHYSERADFASLWRGVKKEDPSFTVLHDQLIKQFGEEGAKEMEPILTSDKLDVLRDNMFKSDAHTLINKLVHYSRTQQEKIIAQLDLFEGTAKAFGELRLKLDPESKHREDWSALSQMLSGLPLETKQLQQLKDNFLDVRTEEIVQLWGTNVARDAIRSAARTNENLDSAYTLVKDERVLRFNRLVKPETIQHILVNALFNDRPMKEVILQRIEHPQLESILKLFPWYEAFIKDVGVYPNDHKIKPLLEMAAEGKSPEELLGYLAAYTQGDQLAPIIAEFPKYDAGKLAKAMEGHDVPWGTASKLPVDQIENFKDSMIAMIEKSSNHGGAIFGNKVLADILRKITKSPEQFVGGLPHLLFLEQQFTNYFRSLYRGDLPTEHVDYVESVVGAQEEVSNKDLRDKLEASFFHQPDIFSPALLAEMPKEALASLPIFAQWFTELGRDRSKIITESPELVRLTKTLFSGQVFKKRTDLDRFNYFLLESQAEIRQYMDKEREKAGSDMMRTFFENGTRVMEQTAEAKKRFFAITQQLRGLGFLDKSLFMREVANVTKSMGEMVEFTPEDIAKLKEIWKKEIENNIETIRSELNAVDVSTEEGQKTAKKLQKKMEDQEKKFKKDPTTAELKEKKINDDLDLVQKRLDDLMSGTFEGMSGVKLSQAEIIKLYEAFKEPSSITLYLGKLKESGDKRQLDLYRTYLESIAHGGFPGIRYALERKHLEKVFEGRNEDAQKWYENISFQVMSTQETESGRTARKRMESFVVEAIDHRHIEGRIGTLLDEFLKNPSSERKMAAEKVAAHILTLKDLGNAPDELKDAIVAHKLMSVLNLSSAELKQDPNVDSFMKDVREAFNDDHPFVNDLSAIKGVIESIRTADKNKGSTEFVTVEETEDPDVMLRLGTDVAGSCQNINGTPSLNRNLISYVMDGKIKVLVVRDNTNTIIGRALLRVLYDETSKKPVLQLERSYHRDGGSAQSNGELLVKIAKQRAELMGYTLVGTVEYRNNVRPDFDHELKSYGGPGSTEYVDSGRGQRENGIYSIDKNTHVVISP